MKSPFLHGTFPSLSVQLLGVCDILEEKRAKMGRCKRLHVSDGREADGQRREKTKIQPLFPVIIAKSSRSSGGRLLGCETWK